MTATNPAEDDKAPSTTADAKPRRPMRRMQRTRGSARARRLASAQVPSGLSSSTNTTSQAMPPSAASSFSTTAATFARSL